MWTNQSSFRKVWPDPWCSPCGSSNSWDSRSIQYGAGDTRNGYCLTLQGDSVALSIPESVSQVTGIQALPFSNTRCLADNHVSLALQQLPPCRGEQAAQLFQVSPANKKLYGNLRVSFTKGLLQQPLLGLVSDLSRLFCIWVSTSFSVTLYYVAVPKGVLKSSLRDNSWSNLIKD